MYVRYIAYLFIVYLIIYAAESDFNAMHESIHLISYDYDVIKSVLLHKNM